MTTETSIYEYAKQGLALSAEKTAIWFYGKSITYRELFEKIDNVADHLYELGVREGTVVTIHLPNCPQAVMAIYAVAKLGGICNMVHALMPREGLKDNMTFTESDFLITYKSDCLGIAKDELLVDILYHMGLHFKFEYRLNSRYKRQKNAKPFEAFEKTTDKKGDFPEQSSLAGKCAVYLNSSGTTGQPKTVMHRHSSFNCLVDLTFSFLHCSDFTDQVVLAELPLFHGFGLIDNLHDAISGGGQIVQLVSWDCAYAARCIDKYRITFMAGVPKIYTELLKLERFSGKSLTHCYVGGERVNAELKREFNSRFNRDSLLYEGYGLAETIAYFCSSGPYCDNLYATGYAMPTCKLAVIDDRGVISYYGKGELLVSTKSIMIGYLKDPDSTKDVFIYWDKVKWLKTGDYGNISPDGSFHFIERIKNIIVKNGYNIFPNEIEGIARSINHVIDVCVVGVKSELKDSLELTVYIVANDEKETDRIEKDFREECVNLLPPYSYPQKIVFIHKMPYNNMGKIDRQLLVNGDVF